jgi:serine/threonine protein kinase
MRAPQIDNAIASAAQGAPGPVAPSPSAARERIGKYELVALRGRGGMGVVHQAFDPFLEREVAIKVMLPQIAEQPEHKQRFEREARAVAKLAHPNVVTLFDLGYHTDGSPYIVMELLRGRDLLAALQETPPPSLDDCVSFVLQVLEGLGHAHKLGIVHRDIKPANVFLTEDGTAKIMDFGIARINASEGANTGTIVGTASYMSPEQVRGQNVDGRSDLFSVGCMLYELATGRRPFDGDSVMATLYRIAGGDLTVDFPPEPTLAPLVPVVRRALARNPDERYATAGAFAAALRACREAGAASVAATAEVAAKATPPSDHPDTRPASPQPTVSPPSAEPAGPTTRRLHVGRLFELLRHAYVGRRSGHLHVTVGTSRKGLRVRAGQIIDGTSDRNGEHLGDVLVRYGLLTQENLDHAVVKVLGERRKLGDVLLELGLLERPRIQEALGLHVREILFSVLETAEASFGFEEIAESAFEADLVCPLSMGAVILEATQRVQDPELVRRVLGDRERILVHSPNPMLRSQPLALSPIDGFILSRIDGTLSASEVASLVSLPPEDVERSLFGLLCTGIVDYRAEAPVRAPSAPSRTTSFRPAATPVPMPVPAPAKAPPPPTPAADPGRTSGPSVEELRRLILDGVAGLKHDHFEVLGLERTATEAQVKDAYARFARVLHPDACAHPELTSLARERDLLFARLSEAVETLRDPASRARYEQAFPARRAPRTPLPPAPPPPTAPPPVVQQPADPTPPPPVTEDVVARAREMLKTGMYWEAIQVVEPAVPRAQGALQIRLRLLLAQAYQKNPMWKRRSEDVLKRVLETQPTNVPALVMLGSLYATGQLPERARAMFKKALELDPANSEARQSLEALDGPEGGPRSALGALFGRR